MLQTLRKSLRRKKHAKLAVKSRPNEWQQDKESVKVAKCSFPVKYLGCKEVQDCRGMNVCEQAVKDMKTDKKKKIRAILYISSDALKLVEHSTKALLLDQTIEKVSFCTPDKNDVRAFSYISRDGTTQRWLCHSFLAVKETGDRLSHAVGCAFATCLEKRQKREKSTGVKVTYDKRGTLFFKEGSFRVASVTEKQQLSSLSKPVDSARREVCNPSAIPRPHAPLHLIRQASLRQFGTKTDKENNLTFPFKRHYSVQVNNLPSTIDRRNFRTMNPVPEVEKGSDVDGKCSGIFTDNHCSDSSTTASGIAPSVSPASGYVSISKPDPINNSHSTTLTAHQDYCSSDNSPLIDTNALPTNTQQHVVSVGATNNMFMHSNRQVTSEADQWLNTIQWQTESVPKITTAHFLTMAPKNTDVISDECI